MCDGQIKNHYIWRDVLTNNILLIKRRKKKGRNVIHWPTTVPWRFDLEIPRISGSTDPASRPFSESIGRQEIVVVFREVINEVNQFQLLSNHPPTSHQCLLRSSDSNSDFSSKISSPFSLGFNTSKIHQLASAFFFQNCPVTLLRKVSSLAYLLFRRIMSHGIFDLDPSTFGLDVLGYVVMFSPGKFCWKDWFFVVQDRGFILTCDSFFGVPFHSKYARFFFMYHCNDFTLFWLTFTLEVLECCF